MNARAWPVLLLCLVCQGAFADTLVMKSGENKKGKILEETERSVLFNAEADGVVLEVPRSSIAIVDRDAEKDAPSKGHLQVFSEVPKKRKSLAIMDVKENESPPASFYGVPAQPLFKKDGVEQAAAFQSFMKLIEDWVRSHPEAEKYIQEWIKKFKGKEGELDKLAQVAGET